MVTTMRDKEVFLLAPGDHSNIPMEDHPAGHGAILVVEDDAPTLRLERVLLEEEGYSVEVVSSGEEAIEAIATKKPALVLLDIGLPGIDGFTTCQRIREISRVPIIMVTGRDCLDDKVKGMNVGADDYVTKPFLTHELATRVKVVLRRASFDAETPPHQNGSSHSYPQPTGPAPQHASNGAAASPPSQTRDEPATHVEESSSPAAAPEGTALPGATPSPDGSQKADPHSAPVNAPEPSPPVAESQDAEPDSPPAESAEPEVSPGTPSMSVAPNGEIIYEGTVRLAVTTLGPVSHLINFVSELRQNSQFRLLRLVANQHKEGMDIWLGLREPLSLKSALSGVKGVAEVDVSPQGPTENTEPVLKVLLS